MLSNCIVIKQFGKDYIICRNQSEADYMLRLFYADADGKSNAPEYETEMRYIPDVWNERRI